MPIYKRGSGAWVSSVPRKRTSGSTVTATSVLKRVSGAWVEVLGITLSATPPSINRHTTNIGFTTQAVTVTATGGGASKTYSWSWVNNAGSLVITSPSSASTTFSKAGMQVEQTYWGTARCTVSDGVTTATIDVVIEITRDSPN